MLGPLRSGPGIATSKDAFVPSLIGTRSRSIPLSPDAWQQCVRSTQVSTKENVNMTTLSYSVAGTRLQPSRQGEPPHQAGQERRDLDSTVLPLLPRKYRSATAARARLWLVGVALGALAVACCSCAAPISNDAKLHLAASPEDFKALGIGKEIEVREDGRRTPKSPAYFEWWYFDGLLDDGTVFVVWFGYNWLYGSHKRALNIDLTLPGKPTRHIMRTFDDRGA